MAAELIGCGPSAGEGPLSNVLLSPIVGGSLASSDPAVVAFSVGRDSPFCTGTLIAPQTVLTAAHCINAHGKRYPYFVLFGADPGRPTQAVRVAGQYANPSYNGSAHDFGVLELATPVLGVTPIEANPTPLTIHDVGKPIRHVGFGVTDAFGTGDGRKREVAYTVRQVQALLIESGGVGKQTCSGDSGGPGLMVTSGSSAERLVGVISFGDEQCAEFGYDGRVDAHLTWIKQTFQAWEVPTCADDGRCLPGCAPIDQDCACQSDGVCSPDCTDLGKDSDCPADCGQNGVCSMACPRPDTDCVALGDRCSSEAVCPDMRCVNDPQNLAFYCSKPCAQSADCPSGMECSAQTCLKKQKPELELEQVCTASDFCRLSVCTGPSSGPLRCALTCATVADCPSGYTCEGGINGERYCLSPAAPVDLRPVARVVEAPRSLPAAEGCNSAGGSPILVGLALLFGLVAKRRHRCAAAIRP